MGESFSWRKNTWDTRPQTAARVAGDIRTNERTDREGRRHRVTPALLRRGLKMLDTRLLNTRNIGTI